MTQGAAGPDDYYQAALEMAGGSRVGQALVNGWAESTEEGIQAVLEPVSFDADIDGMSVIEQAAYGMAGGVGMSLGNIAANSQVGLLFIAMGEAPKRLRVNGRAEIVRDDPAMAGVPGAQMLIKVTPAAIFPNCPRYIPNLQLAQASPYLPKAGEPPIEPKWKSFEIFADVVPPRRR